MGRGQLQHNGGISAEKMTVLARCSNLERQFLVHLGTWYHKLAFSEFHACQRRKPKKLTLGMVKGVGTRRRAVAAFDDADPEIEKECRLEEMQSLQYELEDYYLFGDYEMTVQTQLKLRAIQVTLYGATSWQVLDTDHELMGVLSYWSSKVELEDWTYEARVSQNVAMRFFTMKVLGPRVDHVPNRYNHKFIYPYGKNCSKILMAVPVNTLGYVQAIVDGIWEGTELENSILRLKLYQGAFEDRLEKFGPDSLLTLTAQRLYYHVGWLVLGWDFGADISAKRCLLMKLHELLGCHHHLCFELDALIGIVSGRNHPVAVFMEPDLLKKIVVEPEGEKTMTKSNVTLASEPVAPPPQATLQQLSPAKSAKKKRKKKKSKKKSGTEATKPQTPVRKKHESNGYESCSSFTSEAAGLNYCSSDLDSGTMCEEETDTLEWGCDLKKAQEDKSIGPDDKLMPSDCDNVRVNVSKSLKVMMPENGQKPPDTDLSSLIKENLKPGDVCKAPEDVRSPSAEGEDVEVQVEATKEVYIPANKKENVSNSQKTKNARKKYVKNSETGETVATIITTHRTDSESNLEPGTNTKVEKIHPRREPDQTAQEPSTKEDSSAKESNEIKPGTGSQKAKKKKDLPKAPLQGIEQNRTPEAASGSDRKLSTQKHSQSTTATPLKKSPSKPLSPKKTPASPNALEVLRPPTLTLDPVVKASKDQWQTFVTINGPEDPETLTLKLKHAECLLKDHQYDQAFSFLLELYPVEAQQRGYNHEVPMAILHHLCSPSVCKEFLSFPMLQAVKSFLDKTAGTISMKLSKNHRLTIKTRFFQGYLTSVVDDNIHEANRMMTAARDSFKDLHGPSEADFLFNWKIAMNLLNVKGQEWRAYTLFDQAKTGLPKNLKRLKLMYDADAALVQAKLSQYSHAWSEIQKTYSKASICENQRPNDPILIHVLETALEIVEMIQACDTVEDIQDLRLFKDAYDRQEKLLGVWHPNTVKVGVIYCAANYNPTKAYKDKDYMLPQGLLSFCTVTVDRSNSIFGPVHQVTTRAKQVLAGLMSIEGGQTRLLKRHLSEAVRDRKAVFGDKHEAYYSLCRRASVIYEAIGDLQAAAQHATIWKIGSEAKHGVKHMESSKAKKTVNKVFNEKNRRFGAV